MEQNLNLYLIFYEVAHCRNFSVAAKKLYISQPAVSKSIAKLEESLNTILFHRSSRGVTLTSEGELLFKYVETAVLSLQNGEEQLKSTISQGVLHLSIGVSTTLCKYVLLPLLKNYIAQNPNIKITISCQSTYETIAELKKGTIDIGLVGIPQELTPESNSISYLSIKKIEDIFVATETYLSSFLYQNKSSSYYNDIFLNSIYDNASFIMLDKENISRKHADTFLSEHHLIFKNIIEVNNMDLSIEFAKAGLGIACVINDFIKQDIKNGTLHELKFKHKIPKRQIGFAYPAKAPITSSMNSFIQYYQSHIK